MDPAQPKDIAPMKTIGIIGGSSDVSTAEYYRLINQEIKEKLGKQYTGEIIINSMNFARSNSYLYSDDIAGGGEYIGEKAAGLERAGADFIVLACNTWHCAVEIFMRGINIPLIHIVDPTADAIKAARIDSVALLGTRPTMEGDFLRSRFEDRYGIQVLVPPEEDRVYIDHVIFEELTKGIFDLGSKRRYLSVIERLKENGAQGIVLGCTEISLLVSQTDIPDLAVFDTTELHVKAAVKFALNL